MVLDKIYKYSYNRKVDNFCCYFNNVQFVQNWLTQESIDTIIRSCVRNSPNNLRKKEANENNVITKTI